MKTWIPRRNQNQDRGKAIVRPLHISLEWMDIIVGTSGLQFLLGILDGFFPMYQG